MQNKFMQNQEIFFYKQHKKSIIKKVSSVLSYLNKETL